MNSTLKISDTGLDEQGCLLLGVPEFANLQADVAAVAALHRVTSLTPLVQSHLRLTREGVYLEFSHLAPEENLQEALERVATWTRAIEQHGLDPTPLTATQLHEAESAFAPATLQSLRGQLGKISTSRARRVGVEFAQSQLEITVPHKAQADLYIGQKNGRQTEPSDARPLREKIAWMVVRFPDGVVVHLHPDEPIRPGQEVLISLGAPQTYAWHDQPWTDDGGHDSRE